MRKSCIGQAMQVRFSRILGAAVLLTLVVPTSAQVTDQAGREQARNVVRSQLHLKPDQFLQVRRDEELEQSLASIVSRPLWSEFIYKVSQEGDEIRENVVIHHIFTDGDPTWVIAISPTDGSTYRIRGFSDSLTEFDNLMTSAKVRVLNPDQAEAVADFYQEVNPQRNSSLTPIRWLIALKQAAEWNCQTSMTDADERAFNAWWRHRKPLYREISFEETAVPHGSGFLVGWIVLSSPGPGNCGGAPLRAQLGVEKNGQIDNLPFLSLTQK
jgi:hypothetical protein